VDNLLMLYPKLSGLRWWKKLWLKLRKTV
jgi:hypothetical protein